MQVEVVGIPPVGIQMGEVEEQHIGLQQPLQVFANFFFVLLRQVGGDGEERDDFGGAPFGVERGLPMVQTIPAGGTPTVDQEDGQHHKRQL